MKNIAIYVILSLPIAAPAQEPTTHTSLHVSIEKLVNSILPCPHGVDLVMTSKYKQGSGQISDMVLTGKYIERVCESEVFSITVSWEIPTAREDGTILNPDEILRYELDCDGIIYPVGSDITQYAVSGLKSGPTVCRVRAIDTDGLESKWSDAVTVDLK
jgi:hypothetical protein